MCVTSSNSETYDTVIGAWEINHPKQGYIHVYSYKNTPQNLSDVPNCMLLPIPSKGHLSPENILDTSKDPNLLDIYKKTVMPNNRSGSKSLSNGSPLNFVFEMGVYHISILNNLSLKGLNRCLELIPEEKRPEISPELFNFYIENYPDHKLILACFNNSEAKIASPIMLYYNPLFPDAFVMNCVEGHGEVPDINIKQTFHQDVMFGTDQIDLPGYLLEKEVTPVIHLKDRFHPHLRDYLPNYMLGMSLSGHRSKNRDLIATGVSNLTDTGKLKIKVGMAKDKLKPTLA